VHTVQYHTIRREVVELVLLGEEADGFALQRKLADLCRGWLTPALEEALSRAVPGDVRLVLERLEVDAGRFTPDTFEHGFVKAAVAAVEKGIKDGPAWQGGPAQADGGAPRRMTEAESVQEAFLHFLATGALPWGFRLAAGQTLEEALTASWREAGPAAAPGLAGLLVSPVARLRLMRQFSRAFLERLLDRLSPPAAGAARGVLARIARAAPAPDVARTLSAHLWQAAFALIAARVTATEESLIEEMMRAAPASPGAAERQVLGFIAQARPGTAHAHASTAGQAAPTINAVPGGAAAPGTQDALAAAAIDLDEGIFVDCAGVVLLHPFLPALFERLGLAVDGKLLVPDRALAVLHFLATGAATAPEYALVLPKALCGLAPGALSGAPVELAEEEMAQADRMLAAAIGHWGALRDASPDALRGTFLTRPGKLSMRGGDYLLQVEEQSFDVLLDHLPWSISAVRLPWMARIIWVEWRM
jgi:hypothetical protein